MGFAELVSFCGRRMMALITGKHHKHLPSKGVRDLIFAVDI